MVQTHTLRCGSPWPARWRKCSSLHQTDEWRLRSLSVVGRRWVGRRLQTFIEHGAAQQRRQLSDRQTERELEREIISAGLQEESGLMAGCWGARMQEEMRKPERRVCWEQHCTPVPPSDEEREHMQTNTQRQTISVQHWTRFQCEWMWTDVNSSVCSDGLTMTPAVPRNPPNTSGALDLNMSRITLGQL